jgi:ubiquitin thioesterase protein OTUB1
MEPNNDTEILHQEQKIREDVAASSAMIGVLASPEDMVAEYENASNVGFVPGLRYLASKYQIRRVRGDGNCFYRAFLFAYLENLLIMHASADKSVSDVAEVERKRMEDLVMNSKEELVAIGYSDMVIESFHDTLMELIEGLFSKSREDLLACFQEDGQSDYYTWFMRLLTAGAMRVHAERFIHFVDDGITSATGDMEAYVKREVEPMGKECEQIHITALTEYLNVSVAIEYLDGRPFENQLSKVVFNEVSSGTTPFVVTLLYRPGHYDILYSL